MIPTFDEWFATTYGADYRTLREIEGDLFVDSFRALSEDLRAYVTHCMQAPRSGVLLPFDTELQAEFLQDLFSVMATRK